MASHQVIETIALDACVRANSFGISSWLGEDQSSHSKSQGQLNFGPINGLNADARLQ